MASLVVLDVRAMSMDRYEIGGEAVRKTHACALPATLMNIFKGFDKESVEVFRTNPPDDFKIDPPPRPTNSPAGAGTVRKAA